MMQRNTVKRIFIFFLLFLPLQYITVGIFSVLQSEPWPAFILPAFKSVYSSRNNIVLKQVRFFVEDNENEARTEISPAILFRGIQRSQLTGFLRSHFADSSQVMSFSKKTKTRLKEQIHQHYPSLKAETLHIEWSQRIFMHTGSALMRDSVKISKQFNLSLPGA